MPARLEIEGGIPLRGTVKVSAAKNAALPALAAALLTAEPLVFPNLPDLQDVRTMIRLLQTLGATIDRNDARASVRVARVLKDEAAYELVSTMRASVLVLGPLGARRAARRMRDRRAPHRSAPEGPGQARCGDRDRERLRRRPSQPASRRVDNPRHGDRDGHREPHD